MPLEIHKGIKSMTNESGQWLYGNPNEPYEVHEGDNPPAGYIILAAPGGNVPGDFVARYDLEEHLKGDHKPHLMTATGEPIVTLDNGRAFAMSAVPPHMQSEEHRALVPRNSSTAEVVRAEMARQKLMGVEPDDIEEVEEDDPDKPGHKRTVRRKKGTAAKSHAHAHSTKAVHKRDVEDK